MKETSSDHHRIFKSQRRLFYLTEQKARFAGCEVSKSIELAGLIHSSFTRQPFLFLLLPSSSSFLIGCVESLVLPPIVAILINRSVRRRADDIEWKKKKRIDSYLN